MHKLKEMLLNKVLMLEERMLNSKISNKVMKKVT